ncbi:MAG TPA: amidohydrolase family protein [Gemmataceae bacterium]|jgi:imidazolonepropionase-like amidohydrolase|nr:amidohydrolase family protein [Gemmataceae bacterium]
MRISIGIVALTIYCAQPTSTVFAQGVVVRGGSLFDPVAGSMAPVQAIVIDGEKIVAVGTPKKPVDLPKGARVIDANGKFILPGLIDAHVHLVHRLNFAHVTGDEVLPLFLANGVTTVRDTGDEIVAQTLVAHFAAAHPGRCPRVFMASFLLDADPPIHRDIGLPVADPTKVPGIVDDMVAWKVTTLKIYASAGRPVGRKVIEEGHRRGLFVTGHLSAYRAQDAIEDGIDCLEHITSVFDFAIPPELARQPHPRSTLDLANPQAKGLIALLAKRNVMVDPTLTVFKNMLLLSDLEEVHQHADNAKMPERLRTYWDVYRRGQSLALSTRDRRKGEFAKYQELTGLLHKTGVPLLVGTDAPEPYCPPGYALHQEMELMVESGLTPTAVLQAATIHNARALKEQDRLGSIAAGKLADLVILDADPTADIRNTRKIIQVVRSGIVCDPAQVLRYVPTK